MSSPQTPGQSHQLTSNSDESGNRPSTSRDDAITNARTVFKDDRIIEDNALVVADAAIRRAMRVLRNAQKVRDNIIQHRKAFLQRRNEARKDLSLVQQSVMDAFSNDPHDKTGGRTIVQWKAAMKHYRTLMPRAPNAAEREYWWRMYSLAHFFVYGHASHARSSLYTAGNLLKTWEQEDFELPADEELERARQRKSDLES